VRYRIEKFGLERRHAERPADARPSASPSIATAQF
jgi:hypothetical protein